MSDREWVRFRFKDIYEYTDLDDLERIIQEAREEEAKGTAKDFMIGKYCEDYGDKEYTALFAYRPETDGEMNTRLALKSKWAKDQEARDQAELQRLLKKYNP